MKNVLIAILAMACSNVYSNNIYWTVKPTNGVVATTSGAVAINIVNNTGNTQTQVVWFGKTVNPIGFISTKALMHTEYGEILFDQMMVIALPEKNVLG